MKKEFKNVIKRKKIYYSCSCVENKMKNKMQMKKFI